EHESVAGGGADGRTGWYVEPTLVKVDDAADRLLCEEIFGPVVSVHVYEGSWDDILKTVDRTGSYGLTCAVFSNDRYAVEKATEALRFSAGNFYVNDKPTGTVVVQQPFGCGRT